ncbi:Transposon Tf2-8 polyprotein [Thelohanellus kitauei]|uniref:Transposon Tf2-8 polyprotein n=1 Tax=Thelohanellus kitauei TaxID=669202 RepID=A0A0C2N449_THEKT|nr:Transposon Tf2-8 polyprotein [Thelohanellus kitauei]
MINYYQSFIHRLATATAPLTDKLKNKTKWEWNALDEELFKRLKSIVAEDVMLFPFDPRRKIVINTDASDIGLVAILGHLNDNGKIDPVAFASRKLKHTEQKYSTVEKNILTIY